MTGLSKKDQQRVLDHVQQQGVTVTNTKSGYLMRMPDGGTAMLHKTTSDHMAPMALRAKLRRHGISWPFDGELATIPSYITEGTVRQATLDRWRRAIAGDDPLPDEVFPREATRAEHELRLPGTPLPKSPNFVQTYRVLYRLGYVPGGRYGSKSQGKAWMLRSEGAKPEPVKPPQPFAPAVMFAPEPEMKTEPTPEVKPAPVVSLPTAGEREFLDSVDSWTLDLGEVGDLTVDALARAMRAAGLELEVRVWRRAS